MDLVRELRARGLIIEANKLRQAHLDSLKELKRQHRNDFQNQDNLIRTHFGICWWCSSEAIKNSCYCDKCLKRKKDYYNSSKKLKTSNQK